MTTINEPRMWPGIGTSLLLNMVYERHRNNYRFLLGCLDPADSRSGWGKEYDCPWEEEDWDMVRLLADFDRKATRIQRLWRSFEELPMACPCPE